jgi:CRP-like cAMP-binding protein
MMTTDQPEREPLRAFIVRNASWRRFNRHARVHRAGEKLYHVYLLEDGWIARVRTDRGGAAAFTALYIAGDVIGADALSGYAVADDFIALTSVRVRQVPLTVLRADAATDASLSLALAGLLARETVFLREALFAVGRQPSEARLCTFFLQTFQRLVGAGLTDPAATSFDLPLTQADLATATGLTSVHVNRVLKRLRERGWLKFHDGTVHLLNAEALQRHAQVTS